MTKLPNGRPDNLQYIGQVPCPPGLGGWSTLTGHSLIPEIEKAGRAIADIKVSSSPLKLAQVLLT